MPSYDYECKSCGHRFEVFQSMSDEPIKKCPKCGRAVRRLIGAGLGVIFKGSGFYVTDNRSSSSSSDRHKPKSEKATTESSAPSDSSSSGDSGSKSATGTDNSGSVKAPA
jgi:putative FmdB family regulatory protein